MTRSENTLTHAFLRKSIFRTSHTCHNCLLQRSQLENPSVLMGSGIGDWDGLTTPEIAPSGAISRLCHDIIFSLNLLDRG